MLLLANSRFCDVNRDYHVVRGSSYLTVASIIALLPRDVSVYTKAELMSIKHIGHVIAESIMNFTHSRN